MREDSLNILVIFLKNIKFKNYELGGILRLLMCMC